MRTNFFKVFALIAIVCLAMSSCTSIEPGEAGLKIYKLGDKKGQIEVLGVGRHALHWFGYYTIKVYPTNIQQWSWTLSGDEGSRVDESIHFQSEGQDLSCDVGIAFTFDTEGNALATMYEYFKCEPQDIIERFLRKDVRNFFNEVSANMKVDEVYAQRKEELRAAVLRKMQEKYKPLGIDVQEISYLSLIRLPKEVQDAVNLKITAKQRAEQRENEIAEKEAEAKKKAAEAQGEAERLRIEAEGRAKAIEVEGRALANNPQILRLKEIEMQMKLAESAKNWNTVVMSSGQAGQLLNIGNGK